MQILCDYCCRQFHSCSRSNYFRDLITSSWIVGIGLIRLSGEFFNFEYTYQVICIDGSMAFRTFRLPYDFTFPLAAL